MQVEDDEILEEIDVFYNGDLNGEIFVMQYPLRPSDKPYGDHADLSKVMLNKENSNLKLVYSIESKMKNFDTQYYEGKNFIQSLQGQKIDPNTNYCVGVFKNNMLYLNPVSNFIQFRNDFSHMEAAELARKKNKEKVVNSRKDSINVSSGVGLGNMSGNNGVINNSINLTNNPGNFTNSSQGVNINISDNKQNPLSALQSSLDYSTSWLDLKFYKKDTIQSYQIYEKLSFDDNLKLNKINFVENKEFYEFFFSNINREINQENQIGINYRDLIEQPLHLKLEFFIKKLPVMNFNNLKKISKSENVKDEIFLENCLKFARILKNGNLILKSEVKYDPKTKSDLCTKRNYMINLLQNTIEGLRRLDIKFLESNEINEILGEIGKSVNGLYYFKESDEMEGENRDIELISYSQGKDNLQNLTYAVNSSLSPEDIIYKKNLEFVKKFKNLYEEEVAYWDSINIKRQSSERGVHIIINDVNMNLNMNTNNSNTTNINNNLNLVNSNSNINTGVNLNLDLNLNFNISSGNFPLFRETMRKSILQKYLFI